MSTEQHPGIEITPLQEREGRWEPAGGHKPVATLHLPMSVDEFTRTVRKLDEVFPGCVLSTAEGGIDIYAAPRSRPTPAPALRRPEVKQIRT